MPSYLSPGVYVEEIPSAVQAIAGVGTSTAGFIGIVPDEITMPTRALRSSNRITNQAIAVDSSTDGGVTFPLAHYPVDTAASTFSFVVKDASDQEVDLASVKVINDHKTATATVQFDPPVTAGAIAANYHVLSEEVTNETVGFGNGKKTQFRLANSPVIALDDTYTVAAVDADGNAVDLSAAKVSLENNSDLGGSFLTIEPAPADKTTVKLTYRRFLAAFVNPDATGMPKLCTNFGDFQRVFGGFSTDVKHRNLAHAVFGFFHNGGTRCFVAGVKQDTEIANALTNFGAVDEIALVAAPGLNDASIRDQIVTHCKIATQDRFALLDSDAEIDGDLTAANIAPPPNSDYAAFYFP